MSKLGSPIVTGVAGSMISSNALLIGGTLAAVYAWNTIPKYIKRKRAERYARANIGNPVVTAAAIIHESFARIGFKDGLFSYLLPEFDIFTDEEALMGIASQIDDIRKVAHAYAILFDRDLFTDTLNGLSTDELSSFYNAIRAPSYNPNPQIDSGFYLIGDYLYCAKKTGIQVPQVELQSDGSWITTEKLYGNYKHKDFIGEVIATDIYAPENKRYYLVQWCAVWGLWCYQGVVWSDQVINYKI
jgi:hypothetical protein